MEQWRRPGCRSAGSAGVNHIFGIPGAKIDKVFDSLVDSSIQLIPVRHEANAAFMAAAMPPDRPRRRSAGDFRARLLKPVTGMATATSEGDPVVAIGGR